MIAIDWGTTSLRGARLDVAGQVLEQRQAPLGILSVPAGGFAAVFEQQFGDWWREESLCLMAGMVGSQQGWQNAPYCACPAGWDDIAAALHWVEPGRLAIVPGLSCRSGSSANPFDPPPDVMRGEETQVLGALHVLGLQDATLVLPGTHSKWVQVQQGRITDFRTHMTGECFQMLRRQSLLARTLPPDDDTTAFDEEAFAQGVSRALKGCGLLHNAFGTRTLALFERVPAQRLTDYLSGLVIGEEIRHQQQAVEGPLVLFGAAGLVQRYRQAMQMAGRVAIDAPTDAGWQALWRLSQTM